MSMKKRVAMYGGSFDPITKGHEWVIEEALSLFDKLYVVVCPNSSKTPMFDLAERQELVEKVCRGYGKNVVVESMTGLYLVEYAFRRGATHLIRGIRNASDLEAEKLMRQVNANIRLDVKTLFLHTPKEFEEVSSSMVKSLLGLEGWVDVVEEYVSHEVVDAFVSKGVIVR